MTEDFPYHLTVHAARAMAEREIPLAWLARVLADPVRTEPDREDPDLLHALAPIPEHDGRVLRVIYNKTAEPWLIVTAYFDRRQRSRL